MTSFKTFWAGTALLATLAAGGACNRSEPEQQSAAGTAERATESVQRSDGWITTSVQAKYFADPKVRATAIDVDTSNGVVTLRGTVTSDEARQQAVTLARSVEGVTQVQDELALATATADATRPEGTATDRPTGTTGTAEKTGDAVSPAWITTKIHSQYFLDPTVKTWKIDVTTTGAGVVTLAGEVGSQEAKTEAVRIARETEGVTRVEDRLRVRGETPQREATEQPAAGTAAEKTPADKEYGVDQPDAWITAKIQSKYFLDDEVKGREINVDTRDGIVTLKGTVETDAQKRQAVALATSTDGVKSVTDSLEVRPSGERTDAVTPVRSLEQATSDVWITTKIQSKYFLDADVKGHRIDVDTRRGIVTLTGRVASEALKKEAEQIARETEGVKQVTNRLTVGAAS